LRSQNEFFAHKMKNFVSDMHRVNTRGFVLMPKADYLNGKQAKLYIINIHGYLLYILRKLCAQYDFDTAKFLTLTVTP
jgi:hypothetical protein